MANSPLKDLQTVLCEAPGLAVFHHAWQEHQALMGMLEKNLPPALVQQVRQVRRSDPARGIRGSQLTIIAAHTAAAAKIRMLATDWPAQFAAKGMGIQSIKVIAERPISIQPPARPRPERAPIPASVRTKLKELALASSSSALSAALKKLAR